MTDDENAQAWVEALTEAFWREDARTARLLMNWHTTHPESVPPLRSASESVGAERATIDGNVR